MNPGQESPARAAWLEFQFYEGGLRSYLIPLQPRPEWLPQPTAVGPRSGEIELRVGEFAVEFSRFQRDGRRLTWIGCFCFAADRVYGDRGNCCGVGVWLVESFASYPSYLITGLRDLCDLLAREGDNEKFVATCTAFEKGHLEEYVASLEDLVAPMTGVGFHDNEFPQTDYFEAPAIEWDSFFERAAWSVLKFSAAAGCQGSATRKLYVLSLEPHSVIRDGPVDPLPPIQQSVSETMSSIALVLANLRTRESDKLREVRELELKLTEASVERARLNDQLQTLAARLKSLSAAPDSGSRIDGLTQEVRQLRTSVQAIAARSDSQPGINALKEFVTKSLESLSKSLDSKLTELSNRLPDKPPRPDRSAASPTKPSRASEPDGDKADKPSRRSTEPKSRLLISLAEAVGGGSRRREPAPLSAPDAADPLMRLWKAFLVVSVVIVFLILMFLMMRVVGRELHGEVGVVQPAPEVARAREGADK